VPAIFWLIFWLQEDRIHPEPKKVIAIAFVLGMFAVVTSYHAEKLAESIIPASIVLYTIIVYAGIEEFFKYVAAYIGAFKRKAFDEPIDAVIYMITAALGFAALENSFFIITDLLNGDVVGGVITGNLRFIGASLLHVLASGVVGVFIAITFYKSRAIKILSTIAGLFVATVLHTLFNYALLEDLFRNMTQYGIFVVFGIVWLSILLLLVIFEKVKRFKNPKGLDVI